MQTKTSKGGTRPPTRNAYHAGSWYTDDGSALGQQLEGWLHDVEASALDPTKGPARAVISPHAGYSYSGPTAAYAFAQIDPASVNRVFILGPSHHVGLSNCALSSQTIYATPIGNLPIDLEVNAELYKSGQFCKMDKDVDEQEHSIEMQLPYLRKVFEGRNVRVVPIMVGSLDKESEEALGKLLAPYFDQPDNFFVISSDFCHWGKRFSYKWYDASHGPIHASIEWLDREGMRAIESQQPSRFYNYRALYKNTICGRHPIGVLLQTLQYCETKVDLKFVRYAQSSKCKTEQDSSVSYAAAVARALPSAARGSSSQAQAKDKSKGKKRKSGTAEKRLPDEEGVE